MVRAARQHRLLHGRARAAAGRGPGTGPGSFGTAWRLLGHGQWHADQFHLDWRRLPRHGHALGCRLGPGGRIDRCRRGAQPHRAACAGRGLDPDGSRHRRAGQCVLHGGFSRAHGCGHRRRHQCAFDALRRRRRGPYADRGRQTGPGLPARPGAARPRAGRRRHCDSPAGERRGERVDDLRRSGHHRREVGPEPHHSRRADQCRHRSGLHGAHRRHARVDRGRAA